MSTATGGLSDGDPRWGQVGGDVWRVVQTVVLKLHEGLVVFLYLREVVAGVKLGVVALDISSPFLGHIRLELGRLGRMRAVVHDDARAQGKGVVGVIFLGHWSEEVREWFLVNVREIGLGRQGKIHAVDAWWEGVRPGIPGAAKVGWHG